ncbi:MAG: FAD:protein FMN transferase [Gemmatimonadaceae bacterium]|nr:FAD:protein FMN transferase [Gemmatimonadaceae bacterium]
MTRDEAYVCAHALMGTTVSVQVIGHGASQRARRDRQRGVDRAIGWFTHVESVCTRFDAHSELRRLSTRIGEAVPVSPLLFEAVQFALAVADASDGAFDPTVGHRMEARGFDQAHRTGARVASDISVAEDVSYRDVELDAEARTITLHRPLVLDLGAVAKGLALDMAARELAPLVNFALDAGGDLFLGGHNAAGDAWAVGLRHPHDTTQLLDTIHVTDTAVCTSGDYERPGHILHAVHGESPATMASATVVAPSAMVADALATAAYVLGPTDGIALLERHDVSGLLVTSTMDRYTTRAWIQ